MSIKELIISSLLLVPTAAYSYELPSSTGTHRVEFEADEAYFNEYTRLVDLSGQVRLKEITPDENVIKLIRAKSLSIDMSSRTITSSSDFVIDNDSGTIYGKSGFVNYGDNTGVVKDAHFSYGNFNFRGKEVFFDEKKYIYRKSSLTSCNEEPPHYQVKTSVIRIVPEHYFLAYNCLLYIGKVPVFYFPVLYKPVGQGTPFITYLFPGYDSRSGVYLKTNFAYRINPEMKMKVYLDYFTKKGFGTGGEFDFHRQEKNTSNISVYRINEENPTKERWGLNGGFWHSFNNYSESDKAHYYSQSYFRLLSDPQFNDNYFRTNPFAISDDKQASVAFTRQGKYTIMRLSSQRRDIKSEYDDNKFIREYESTPRFDFNTVPFKIPKIPVLNTFSLYVENGRETHDSDYQKKGKAEWTIYKSIPIFKNLTLSPSAFFSESMYLSTHTALSDSWISRYGGKLNLRYDRIWGSLDIGYALTERLRDRSIKYDSASEDKGQEKREVYGDLFIMPNYKTYFRIRSAYDVTDYAVKSFKNRLSPLISEISYSPKNDLGFYAQNTYDFHGSSNSFILQVNAGTADNYIGMGVSNYSTDAGDDGAWIIHNNFGFKPFPESKWKAEVTLRYRAVVGHGKKDSFSFFEKSFAVYKEFHDFKTRFNFRMRPSGNDFFFLISLKMNAPAKENLEEKSREYWRPWREQGAVRDY